MAPLIEQNIFSMDLPILLNVLLVMLCCIFIRLTVGLPTFCAHIDNVTVNSTQSDYHHATSQCHRQSVPGSDEHAYRYTQQVTEQLHEILMTQHSSCITVYTNQGNYRKSIIIIRMLF